MDITDLKEGHGIKFYSEREKERVLPVLHFLGFTNLCLTTIIALSRMTGAALYVTIEKDKKLNYSTTGNFNISYVESYLVVIPPDVAFKFEADKLFKNLVQAKKVADVVNGKSQMVTKEQFAQAAEALRKLDATISASKKAAELMQGLTISDAAFEKAWDAVFKTPSSKEPTEKPGCTWEPYKSTLTYPPGIYKIDPKDALTLISFLSGDYKREFKDKWGDDILDGKEITATGLTRQKFYRGCLNKHFEESKKYFKLECPYKIGELILVRNSSIGDWTPRHFIRLNDDDSVMVKSVLTDYPIKYLHHCKAKVVPA